MQSDTGPDTTDLLIPQWPNWWDYAAFTMKIVATSSEASENSLYNKTNFFRAFNLSFVLFLISWNFWASLVKTCVALICAPASILRHAVNFLLPRPFSISALSPLKQSHTRNFFLKRRLWMTLPPPAENLWPSKTSCLLASSLSLLVRYFLRACGNAAKHFLRGVNSVVYHRRVP